MDTFLYSGLPLVYPHDKDVGALVHRLPNPLRIRVNFIDASDITNVTFLTLSSPLESALRTTEVSI